MREDGEPIQAGAGARSLKTLDPRLRLPRLSPTSANFEPPGQSGLPWRFCSLITTRTGRTGPPIARGVKRPQESQMPKIKTKSSAKKRFKVTGTGKVVYAQSGKRHGMIKRTNKQIRNLRGTKVLFKTDGENVKKYFLPNG
jgi:large subunit ribosomal protein L35